MQNQEPWYSNFLNMPRVIKRMVMIVADVFALVAALWAAFALRLSEWWPEQYLFEARSLFVVAPILGVLIFFKLGSYHAVVRYMNFKLFQSLAIGVLFLAGSLSTIAFIFEIWRVPRSVPIIFILTALFYLGSSRLVVRGYYRWLMERSLKSTTALVYGAGNAGVQLVMSLQSGGKVKPIGFVDDDLRLRKSNVCGLRVYSFEEVAKVVEQKNVSLVLLAMLDITKQKRVQIIESLSRLPVQVKTMPSMLEIIEGGAIDELREINVNDLLGRESITPNAGLLTTSIKGKSVCITGAGGSIGSELSHQALHNGAHVLVLYEVSEFALYSLERELSAIVLELDLPTKIVAVIGSVLDYERMLLVFKQFFVQTVYHAAAYKHVPLIEYNVLQGLNNNTIGTLNAAKAAKVVNAERFVLISTDKAVRPTSVMGATKRFAELCIQNLASESKSKTVFCMVRFGNVLGSSGSVVPLFREQIAKGGPVTVTHPDITRYFMNIPEAASLVIQAGSMANGGEVFVLDMGEPVKVISLAENIIRLLGFSVKSPSNPGGDIEIIYTGLRPGEKLFEELLIGENVVSTSHPKIMCAKESSLTKEKFKSLLKQVFAAIKQNDVEYGRALLKEAVQEFAPSSKNIDWLKRGDDKSKLFDSSLKPIDGNKTV